MSLIKIIIFIASVCLSLSAHAQQSLRIHGSNTVGAQLMPALVTQWLEDKGFTLHSDRYTHNNERVIQAKNGTQRINVEIHAHGSSTGFKSIKAGAADLAMSSRPIKNKELKSLMYLGDLSDSRKEVVVGVDGIAVVAHPSNPIASLSIAQLKAVFSGSIQNWQALGGEDKAIHVYARDNQSGTYDTFKSLVLGKNSDLVSSAKRYESNDALSDDVALDLGGIGFVGLPSIRQSKALGIADGQNAAILPSELSVATEDYPLSRRLYVYQAYADNELAADLARFIKSAQGQSAVASVGFISQNINAYSIDLNSYYPDDYKKILQGAQRLSLNFRFKPGAYKLDNKSLQDIDRLVRFVDGSSVQEVILAGFSDASEAASWRRHVLSTERGDFVAESLIKRGVTPSVVRGFGSSVQVASNSTAKGRDKNRRVEVWVR